MQCFEKLKMAKSENIRNKFETHCLLVTQASHMLAVSRCTPMYVWVLKHFYACIKLFQELGHMPHTLHRFHMCHKHAEYVTDAFSSSLRHLL